MAKTVIGVRFKKAGKIYYFDPKGYDIDQNDHVVVETVQGIEYGEVAIGPRDIDGNSFPFPVKPIVRKATVYDDRDYITLKEKEKKARPIFEEKVKEHGLDMKLVSVDYTFDKRKAVFSFTAEGRVDFRDLVKDLANVFHVRIELRQIGVRDEAKMFNTLGCCGKKTCCSLWLGDFTPVSIKMAKDQNLSLNATKISGVCGRLLCCLNYEDEFYKDVTKRMPKVGQMVETPDGVGQVYRLDMLREKVVVKFINEKEEITISTFALADIEHSDAPKPVKTPKNAATRPSTGKKGAAEAKEKSTAEEESREKQRNSRPRRNRRGGKYETDSTDNVRNRDHRKNVQDTAPQEDKHQRSSQSETQSVMTKGTGSDKNQDYSGKSSHRSRGYFRRSSKKR